MDKFGIGMTQRQSENFWRELVMMLIGVPMILVVGIMIIDTLLQSALGTGLGFIKYFLYGIGFLGWVVMLYKKYMNRILMG